MIDSFAPLVAALTHTGFSMAAPVPRKSWAAHLAQAPDSRVEVLRRLESDPDPNVKGALIRLNAVTDELNRLEKLGIWALTWFHPFYPPSWKRDLGMSGPPLIFGMGSPERLTQRCVAVLGSRDAPPAALDLALSMAEEGSRQRYAIVSGGARGIDSAALSAACAAGGSGIAVAAGALAELRQKLVREGCTESSQTVVTPFHPEAGFSVGQAMGRNKLVYALSDVAVIAACEAGRGGTWTGALEALKRGKPPVAVWISTHAPESNFALASRGAFAIETPEDLFGRMPKPKQGSLFSSA